MSKYILDSNVFIEAKNRYYSFEICPGFWDFLRQPHQHICSVAEVKEELMDKNDKITEFIEKYELKNFFKQNDAQDQYDLILQEARKIEYTNDAVIQFFECADSALIAYALKHQYTIVTHEKSTSGSISKKRIKIPDICKFLSIDCMNTFDFLKAEKVSFDLKLCKNK